jgi:uncharacterized coiled-coil protein SlyX
MRHLALGTILLGALMATVSAGDGAAPAEARGTAEGFGAAAPAAEPVDREAVILRLRARYEAAVERIRANQQAWYEKQPKPSLAYQDRFDATLRHVDGLDVEHPTWWQKEYGDPHGQRGQAALGLSDLASRLRELPHLQGQVETAEEMLQGARERYEEERVRAVNARVRESMTGTSSAYDHEAMLADLEDRIAGGQATLADLDAQMQGLYDELAAWDRQEAQYRALDRQHVAALQAQCRQRIEAGVAKLEERPGFAFIVAHDRLAKSIEHRAGVLRLLEDAASRAEDEERARELDAKIAERRADLEGKQAELAALVEAYFAPAEELQVLKDTTTLASH